MPVHVTAVLDHDTVAQLLGELLPLTIDLGDDAHRDRFIQIDPPQLVEFVDGRGLRIQTGARLQWTVGPMTIPFTVQSVRFLLTPKVVDDRLQLGITLEDTDLKNLPKMIDRGVVTQLNAKLAEKPDAIAWDFKKTLAIRLGLPASLAPLARFEMDAGTLSVSVSDRALTLALPLPMRLARA
jgi:hypothetical protein